jgi:O-antigen/teichoic acid export membrane protein
MKKKFLSNLALILFLNLLIKPIYILGIDTAVQNAVGAASYGIYYAVFNLSFILTIILDFGITNFNNKNIAQNNHLLTKHFSSLVGLKIALAIIYILVLVVVGFCIGYDTRLMKLLLVQGFNMFLIFFILYLRSNLAGLHLFKTDSVVSVIDRILLICLSIYMLKAGIFKGENGIMYFVYAQTVCYFITAVTAFIIILKKTHTFKLTFNWTFSVMILKKSLPFATLILLMSFSRIDTVMIERMLPAGIGDVQSGIYAQAFRLLDATSMIAFLVAGMLLPIFSRMLKFKESVEPLVKLISRLLLMPAIVIGIGCVFYSEELMGMLYHEHIKASAELFSLIMLSFIGISVNYIFGTLLTANGSMKQLNIMYGLSMVFYVFSNYFLIRRYGALGAAITSMTTQFLTALIQVIITQRIFKFKVNYWLINTLVMFAIGVIAINFASKTLHFYWIVNFVIMVVSCGLWAFVSGLISVKSIFRLLKRS